MERIVNIYNYDTYCLNNIIFVLGIRVLFRTVSKVLNRERETIITPRKINN